MPLDSVALLRQCGLSPRQLANPEGLINLKAVCLVLDALARETGREDIGLLLTEHRRASHLGVLGLVAALQADPDALARWRRWLRCFVQTVDITPLLADHGFAPRTAFLSEFGHRLRRKLAAAGSCMEIVNIRGQGYALREPLLAR